MGKLREVYAERADGEGTKGCALCTAKLDEDKAKRGVVEFFDGWFWICGSCAQKVGRELDFTQHDSYGEGNTIPYLRRSRRYALRWLQREYQINITSKAK